jgi:peptide/nickel transport system substrate-binding protein
LTRVAARIRVALAVGTLGVALSTWACRSGKPPDTAGGEAARGGQIVVAVRADPQSFNWLTRSDANTYLVTLLTQAKLVRVNRVTEEVEPWLAEAWSRSGDGLSYTLRLRAGLRFSDGHPLTADDVLFTFRVVYDERASSTLADDLRPSGRPLKVTAPDPATITITFERPFGPGLRILDNLPILPKHKLEAALEGGTFPQVWSPSVPVREVIGAGPFVLAEYRAGERLVFERNPHYFRHDQAGASLPYLDRVVVEVIPDQNTHQLRLEAGEIDMTAFEARHADYGALKRAADRGQVQLLDLGVGYDPDSFWINLKPGAFRGDPREGWLQRPELRRAISLAVDRQRFADTVYLGAGEPAFGPVTPANRKWYSSEVPHTPHDPAEAKRLLSSIGLTDNNGDGMLEGASGHPARFSLATMKGQTALERGAAVIRDELKAIGLAVDVVLLEGNALVSRFLSGKEFDAIYFHFGATDTDPALSAGFWLSSGGEHVWNIGQESPATPWERRIDELMAAQMTSIDDRQRKQLFTEVQRIFAQELPVVHFAAPKIFVAASTRVVNLQPALSRPQLLWSPDTIAVR